MGSIHRDLAASHARMKEILELIEHDFERDCFNKKMRNLGRRRSSLHHKCNSCCEGGNLVFCHVCPAAFHPLCLDPPLTAEDIPRGKWLCNRCKSTQDMDVSSAISRRSSHSKTTDNPRSMLSKLTASLGTTNPKQFGLNKKLTCHSELPGSSKPKMSMSRNRSLKKISNKLDSGIKFCHQCKRSSLYGPLIQCDYCPLSFHSDCLEIPFSSQLPPTSKWMCPNHVEHILDKKFLSPVSPTERLSLWAVPSVPVNQHGIQQKFLDKVAQTDPIFGCKVKLTPRRRIQVPDAIMTQYLHPSSLLPVDHCTNSSLNNTTFYSEANGHSSIIEKPGEDNSRHKHSQDMLPIPLGTMKPIVIESKSSENSVVTELHLVDEDIKGLNSQIEADATDITLRAATSSRLLSNNSMSEQHSIQEDPKDSQVYQVEAEPSSQAAISAMLLMNLFNLKLHPPQEKPELTQAYQTEDEARDIPSKADEDTSIHNPCQDLSLIPLEVVENSVNKSELGDDLVKTELHAVQDNTNGSQFNLTEIEARDISAQPDEDTNKHKPCQNISLETMEPSVRESKPNEYLIEIELQSVQENVKGSTINQVQTKSNTVFSQAASELLSNTSKWDNTKSLQEPTVQSPVEREIPVRAVMYPIIRGAMPVVMKYKSLNIGLGAEMDVCLSNYGHCNYVSEKHATIFYNEAEQQFELTNYSCFGTTVNGTLYCNDISKKAAHQQPPPADLPSSTSVHHHKHYLRTRPHSTSSVNIAPTRPSRKTQDQERACCCIVNSSSTPQEDTAKEGLVVLHRGTNTIECGCVYFVFSITKSSSRLVLQTLT